MCGTSATENDSASSAATVSETPETVIEPFSTQYRSTSGDASNGHARPVALGLDRAHGADPVDVALDDVAAERLARPERGLDVDRVAHAEPSEGRPAQRLGDGVEADRLVVDGLGREAHAVDRDRVADPGRGGRDGRVDPQRDAVLVAVGADDAAQLAHDPGEHPIEATG